jgi:hypothetical protein
MTRPRLTGPMLALALSAIHVEPPAQPNDPVAPLCPDCEQPMGLTYDKDMYICGNPMCGIPLPPSQ